MKNAHDFQRRTFGTAGNGPLAVHLFLLIGTAFLVGCGSGKVAVEGYDQAALNDKRVFLLLPAEGEIVLANPDVYALSRGIGEAGAPGRIATEFRTDLATALDARLDSNTVLEYGQQSVGAVVPLNPSVDMPGGATATTGSWDWDKIKNAARQGGIDYLVVVHSVRVENEAPKEGASRGKETVTVNFSLLDPEERKVMTGSEVRVELKDPRKPADTYTKLAEAMARKLPFYATK